MKNLTPLSVALLATAAAPLYAGVIEDFSGNSDGILAGQTANGPGTTGTWTGDSTDLSVVGGVAVYDRPQDFNASRSATASLSNPLDLTTNNVTYYFAADLSADQAVNAGDDPGVFGVFFDTDDSDNNSVPVILPSDYVPTDGTVSVVVKWTYNPGGDSTSEAYTIWVNPASESDTPHETGTGGEFTVFNNATQINAITVFGENFDGNAARIDNIRAGNSFAEVIPEPSSLALLGLGGLAMIRRR